MENILTAVISSLLAVIATLVGVIRFYLPRHDRAIHNPIELERIRELLEEVRTAMAAHQAAAAERHQAIMAALARLETRK